MLSNLKVPSIEVRVDYGAVRVAEPIGQVDSQKIVGVVSGVRSNKEHGFWQDFVRHLVVQL